MNKINIWEGVYSSFSECPPVGAGFNGEHWVSRSLDEVKRFMENSDEENVILKRNRDNYLPFLISSLKSDDHEPVRILDFGGGLGFTYAATLKKTMASTPMRFSIVETTAVCNAGNEYFKQDKNICFFDSISKLEEESFDIIHFGSCLQYIDGWQGLIRELLKYSPKYVLFTGLLAGNIPEFVSMQNWNESKIPVWFINLESFLGFFSKLNYSLLFKSDYYPTYFGKEQDMPMDNFKEEMRLKRPVNLLFSRGPFER